jgi:hypothetical protein
MTAHAEHDSKVFIKMFTEALHPEHLQTAVLPFGIFGSYKKGNVETGGTR